MAKSRKAGSSRSENSGRTNKSVGSAETNSRYQKSTSAASNRLVSSPKNAGKTSNSSKATSSRSNKFSEND